MAFEDDLGYDSSQPVTQNFTLSATNIVSRTISLWTKKIIQYIIIMGIISAASIAVSFVLLFVLFDSIGSIGPDPINYVIQYLLDQFSNPTVVVLFIGFSIFAFVLNAIVYGAAIKFTLDEYGGTGGDIGHSFSHSLSRLVTIIVVQLIIGAIVAVVLTPSTIYLTRALAMIDISDPYNPIIPSQAIELMMTGMIILLVGGIFLIYIQVRLLPTLAVVVDTDLSAIDSLMRSWDLTSGKFFHTFGSYILLGIIVGIFGIVVSAVAAFTFLPMSYLAVIESFVSSLLFGALTYVYTVVLYRDLVSRTDTSTLQDLMI
ncbi:MAG: hypothetical protein ACFFEK_13330 [Candidatus Thorarchaeota archaeon]